jgi:hypothetical protein
MGEYFTILLENYGTTNPTHRQAVNI